MIHEVEVNNDICFRPENKNRVLYVNSDKSLNAGGRHEEIADSVRLILHS